MMKESTESAIVDTAYPRTVGGNWLQNFVKFRATLSDSLLLWSEVSLHFR